MYQFWRTAAIMCRFCVMPIFMLLYFDKTCRMYHFWKNNVSCDFCSTTCKLWRMCQMYSCQSHATFVTIECQFSMCQMTILTSVSISSDTCAKFCDSSIVSIFTHFSQKWLMTSCLSDVWWCELVWYEHTMEFSRRMIRGSQFIQFHTMITKHVKI